MQGSVMVFSRCLTIVFYSQFRIDPEKCAGETKTEHEYGIWVIQSTGEDGKQQ